MAKRIVAEEEKPALVPAPTAAGGAGEGGAIAGAPAASQGGVTGEKGAGEADRAIAKPSEPLASSLKEAAPPSLEGRSLESAQQAESAGAEAAGDRVGGSDRSTDTAAAAAAAFSSARDPGSLSVPTAVVKEERQDGYGSVSDAKVESAAGSGQMPASAGSADGKALSSDKGAAGDDGGLKRKEERDGSSREGAIKKVKVKVKMQSLNP